MKVFVRKCEMFPFNKTQGLMECPGLLPAQTRATKSLKKAEAERQQILYTADGNVKWCSHL